MNKFIAYISFFVVSVILFVVFDGVFFIDSFILGLFFVSSFFLVFSLEQKIKPSKAPSLKKIPEIHKYVAERYNPYGYLMAGSIVFVSAIYYILSFYLKLRTGEAILIVWASMIILTWLIIQYTSNKIQVWEISDYIKQFVNLDIKVIESIVKHFVDKSLVDKEKMVKYSVGKGVLDVQVAKTFVDKYLEYLHANANIADEITSDEMREINK